MNKYLVILFILPIFIRSFAQSRPEPTRELSVSGDIQTPDTFKLQDFKQLPSHELGDVVITNHAGEVRSTARQLKGILLRDLLERTAIRSMAPKDLSAVLFKCVASDGYVVVFSWNEIFNTATGDHIAIVLEKDGKSFDQMEESILLISPTDRRTGRRYVKGLQSVEVIRLP
ncbi:MAG: hypothetical protein K1X47_15045 [Cyclobacteriaceae bacterium]|nr:hypothetical protein [Cyclobacteriaceae bacterium]